MGGEVLEEALPEDSLEGRMRVLRLAREPSDERTGVFTSGIVSTGQGWKIALQGWSNSTVTTPPRFGKRRNSGRSLWCGALGQSWPLSLYCPALSSRTTSPESN
jgi:hypothetical protein